MAAAADADQITSSQAELEIRIGESTMAEEVALCTQFWRRWVKEGREGEAFDAQTTAQLVIAWREEAWRIGIARPWG